MVIFDIFFLCICLSLNLSQIKNIYIKKDGVGNEHYIDQ